jgi:uncharacterized membrane protein YjgN (DUF898 family)
MTASLAPQLSPLAPNSASMSFSGRGREFLKLLVKGSLFQIPTFGFYRFWLITKLRRHLWANTQVAGEAFEYTGTAKELLIGFLIALAVLTPIYLGYFLAGIFLEEQAALASVPLVLVMYVLMHFAAYRARRYRATRTVFRGVRFWMKGSGWAYAFRAILWDIATILTLGLALPWATASLERYRMRHTYFGSLQGDFTGTGWTLFKRGAWVWALGIAILVGPVLAYGAIHGFAGNAAMGLWKGAKGSRKPCSSSSLRGFLCSGRSPWPSLPAGNWKASGSAMSRCRAGSATALSTGPSSNWFRLPSGS